MLSECSNRRPQRPGAVSPGGRGPGSGFSLVEMTVVVSILLVVSAIFTPTMMTVVANARLRGGITSLSGVLQSCRMIAVKRNRTMSVHFTVISHGPLAYVKDATVSSPTVASTDPQVELGAPVSLVSSLSTPGAPSAALDNTILGFTPATSDASFNPRGSPCTYSSGNCPNSGFVYYLTDTRPLGKSGWAAVTISPAGRIQKWYWNGSAWGN